MLRGLTKESGGRNRVRVRTRLTYRLFVASAVWEGTRAPNELCGGGKFMARIR